MTANIFGDRLAYRGALPWHALGTSLEEPHTMSEAMQIARLNYGIVKRPLWYWDAEGKVRETDRVALVREAWDGAEEALLGVATDAYTPLQNGELAQLLDPLTDEWPVETVGALGKGETVFATLNAGGATVGGDDIQQYFFVYNGHDGTSALKINLTPVRVVCQNTCITGLRQATVTADVAHTRRVHAEAEFAVQLVAQLRRAQQAGIAGLQVLPTIKLTADTIRQVVEAVYPEKPDHRKLAALVAHETGQITLDAERVSELAQLRASTDRTRLEAIKLRLAVRDRLVAFNEERPAYANTGWALYNAVTETECWREGGTAKALGQSILVGERGKHMSTAYAELVKLAV